MKDTLSPRERARQLPGIIQGGMGVAVSNWRLAGVVSGEGEMGTVSGTGIGIVLARRLQNGDPDGAMRDALNAFPDRAIADAILNRYFIPRGRPTDQPFKAVPVFDARALRPIVNLNIAGAFAEVWLAKKLAAQRAATRGWAPGPIAINLLTKIQAPTMSALYGAMVAGVDCVVMGAGIPSEIPAALERLSLNESVSARLQVTGGTIGHDTEFDPARYPALAEYLPKDSTPAFLAIIASNILAKRLSRAEIPPNGFVVEGGVAGGHNAPPRGKGEVDGKPVYDERDVVDVEALHAVGLPFWLAGGYGTPEGFEEATRNSRANGIQAGSIFGMTRESGAFTDAGERRGMIDGLISGDVRIFNSSHASPTGFPFHLTVHGSTPETEDYANRHRICDIKLLTEMYATTDRYGAETIGYRCSAEPREDYLKKGGDPAAWGALCLCNLLTSQAGLGQVRRNTAGDMEIEPSVLTLGDHTPELVRRMVDLYGRDFSATDAIRFLRGASSGSNHSMPSTCD